MPHGQFSKKHLAMLRSECVHLPQGDLLCWRHPTASVRNQEVALGSRCYQSAVWCAHRSLMAGHQIPQSLWQAAISVVPQVSQYEIHARSLTTLG